MDIVSSNVPTPPTPAGPRPPVRQEEETRKLFGSAPASFKRPEAYAAPLLGG